MPNKIATSYSTLDRRHKNIFALANGALFSATQDERLCAKLASLCGEEYPLPELTGANLPGRAMCQRLFDTESERLATFDPDDDVAIVIINSTAWDTSTLRPVIDVERCRKEGRPAFKRLLPSFIARHQVQIVPHIKAPDGGDLVESRLFAIGSGPQLFKRIEEEAAICQRDFKSRYDYEQPIKVRRLDNRRRELVWAGTHMAMCWSAQFPPVDPDREDAGGFSALRQLQIEAMLSLNSTTFGFDKGENLRRSISGCATKQIEATAKGRRGPLHRDEVPHFIAETNLAIGKPEWLIPFAPNRK